MPAARDAHGRFVADPAKIADFVRTGPFFSYMVARGELVKAEARRLVGVHRPTPGERRKRRPGTLRDSIVKRVVQQGDVILVYVGSDDKIALLHHEGTVPHEIHGNPFLVFWWERTGRIMVVRKVNHPGTRPNRYLVNALHVLGD